MNREQLIEKAAKAIDPPAWTGGIAHDPRWADEAEARRISAMRQARAALSVFEEAQGKACTCREALGSHAVNCPAFEEAPAPTDDEREALALALDGIPAPDSFPSGVEFWREEIDSILAAGFRRTVQGEPTDAAVDAAFRSILETAHDVTTREDVRVALRAAAEAEGGN